MLLGIAEWRPIGGVLWYGRLVPGHLDSVRAGDRTSRGCAAFCARIVWGGGTIWCRYNPPGVHCSHTGQLAYLAIVCLLVCGDRNS